MTRYYSDSDESSDEDSVRSIPTPRKTDAKFETDSYNEEDFNSDDDDDPSPGNNNRAKAATGIEAPIITTKGEVKPAKHYRRYFPGVSDETIRRTLKATTQYGTRGAQEGPILRNQIVAPNPILNIPRRQEDVATDTFYSDTPAVNDGSTAAQFFIGRTSKFRTIRALGNSDGNFPEALNDEIAAYGAMNRITSDRAQAQISARVKELCRNFAIQQRNSEPYRGNQNFAEHGWGPSKANRSTGPNLGIGVRSRSTGGPSR